MDAKKLISSISKYAPEIGTLFGGPVGGAVGGLFTAVASLFGVNPEEAKKDPDKLALAIQSDPEAAAKLEQFRLDHKVEIQKLLIQSDQMFLQDRQNARSRQIETQKSTGKIDINLYILAWAFVIGFFVSIIAMLWLTLGQKLPIQMPQYAIFLIGSLFGTLTSGVTSIIQYFFGSSKGSKEKDAWMAQLRNVSSGK